MIEELAKAFEDVEFVDRIKKRLSYLFQLAELDSSRAGKVGMEVGSLRERIIVALLVYKFGDSNVQTELPITEPEVDVKLFKHPVSIKTITGKEFSGVKLIWTVDAQKAREFQENYSPHCDILLVQINWDGIGGFYYLPLEVQKDAFNKIGRENYIKLPKAGTNPRGVEITKEALSMIITNELSKSIEIYWKKTKIKYNPYVRWIDYWKKDNIT